MAYKGHIPWNKGKKMTQEYIEANRQGHLGKKLSEETKKNMSLAHMGNKSFTGKTFTSEHLANLSKAKKGKPFSEIHRSNLAATWQNPEVYTKRSVSHKGDRNPQWRDGLSFEPYAPEFNDKLKEQIRKRDNYTCQICRIPENGIKLHPHHIDYNKKNNDPSNLISLCRSCHAKTNFNRNWWTKYFQVIIKEADFNPPLLLSNLVRMGTRLPPSSTSTS